MPVDALDTRGQPPDSVLMVFTLFLRRPCDEVFREFTA
jgi:hypothetical protein